MERMSERQFNRWYRTHLEKYIPAYAFFSLLFCFGGGTLIYSVTQQLVEGRQLYDLTMDFDRMVPFVPAWVFVYVLSFPFWGVSYILAARENSRDFWFRFVFSDLLARAVCAVIFVVFPTTNVRPECGTEGFWNQAMALIYAVDPPLDLFPSIHCMVSLMCYLGIRKCEAIPRWYRTGTLVFTCLVFASTQFTKQHYIVDVFGGVILALACFAAGQRTQWHRPLMGFFDRLNKRVFGEESDE